MNYSKQYLAELATKTNFIKDNLEKVLRLAEILKFLKRFIQKEYEKKHNESINKDPYGSINNHFMK